MMPIKLSNIHNKLPVIDLFISAISFEERSLSLINTLDDNHVRKIWFAYNHNEKEFYLDKLILAETKNNSELIEFSTDNPIITAQTLANKFNSLTKLENVLIDITTFTHEGLLILYKFLDLYRYKISNLYLAYIGAKEYSVNESEDDNKWLSKGTKTIRSVLGYPGILNPSNKNHLIILFGFESERTAQLIENFEFDKVSIGIGPENDSIKTNHYNINRKRHIDMLKQYPFAETFEFSLTDPLSTKIQIENQIKKYEGYNIVITPLNNKLSTIGTALVAIDNSKVQLCYLRAHEYNYRGYSIPSDDCYIIKIY